MGAGAWKKVGSDPDTPARRIIWRKAGRKLLFEFDKIPLAMAKDSSDICDILGVAGAPMKH
jgi:hypothetical protein